MDDWIDWIGAADSEPGLIDAAVDGAHSTPGSVVGDISEGGSGDPHDSLWIVVGTSVWDLGPADLDADGDGVAESMTSVVADRHVIVSDTDGDGRVDRITTLDAEGTADVADATASGGVWSPTSLGRLN